MTTEKNNIKVGNVEVRNLTWEEKREALNWVDLDSKVDGNALPKKI